MNPYLQHVQNLLTKIERSAAAQRAEYISQLQNKIWEETENEDINNLLAPLAGDLNFYEPFEKSRDETLGYYGDEKLLQLLKEAGLQIEIYMAKGS